MEDSRTPYRLELLPVIHPYHRRAQNSKLYEGQLVYYGPKPGYYGIGEVRRIADQYVFVDFRGTGAFEIQEEAFEPQYLVPIPQSMMHKL